MTDEVFYIVDIRIMLAASLIFFLAATETAMASILIASVILVIVDLDRPRRGLIRVSQDRMVELRESLAKY